MLPIICQVLIPLILILGTVSSCGETQPLKQKDSTLKAECKHTSGEKLYQLSHPPQNSGISPTTLLLQNTQSLQGSQKLVLVSCHTILSYFVPQKQHKKYPFFPPFLWHSSIVGLPALLPWACRMSRVPWAALAATGEQGTQIPATNSHKNAAKQLRYQTLCGSPLQNYSHFSESLRLVWVHVQEPNPLK